MCMERKRLNRPDLSHRRDMANCIQLMEIYEEIFHGNRIRGNIGAFLNTLNLVKSRFDVRFTDFLDLIAMD